MRMRLRFLLITIILLVGLSACSLDIAPETPNCIENKIKKFKKSGLCESGKEVKSFIFQGNTVFVFDPGTCGNDLAADVFDPECNLLGVLGGISGNIEINGEMFSNAIFDKIVWSD